MPIQAPVVLNSPIESGLRVLFILNALSPALVDYQRLLYYDYLVVHSGDVSKALTSLHAPSPYRTGEWLVRRELLSEGINLMLSKELLVKVFSNQGILVGASELTRLFISQLESEYAQELKLRAEWIVSSFASVEDAELISFMSANLGVWGAEFGFESHRVEDCYAQ